MRGVRAEIAVIFTEEFRRQVKRISWRIMTLAVPLLMVIGIAVVPLIRGLTDGDGEMPEAEEFGVVDNAGLFDPERTAGLRLFRAEPLGIDALLAGEVRALFILPENYLQSGSVRTYRTGGIFSGQDESAAFSAVLRQAVLSGNVSDEVLERALNPGNYTTFSVDSRGRVEPLSAANELGEFFVPFIFSILLMIAIFTGAGNLLTSIAEEKENRMIEILVTSVKPISLMTGKVLALGAAGLIQVTVWAGSAALLGPQIASQIPDAGSLRVGADVLVTILLFFLAGYFLFAVIMAGLGAATTSVREASSISAFVTLPAVVPLWASSALIASPDGAVAKILSFIPITAPTAIMIRLAAGDPPVWEIALSLAITVATGTVLLWVSARIFRAGILLYGQRMSLGRVWSALRQAS